MACDGFDQELVGRPMKDEVRREWFRMGDGAAFDLELQRKRRARDEKKRRMKHSIYANIYMQDD
jgi:hypothetical protein